MKVQSKLQENIGVCPTPVPVAAPRNRGIGEFNSADGNCHSPLYIVDGVSAASTNSPIQFHTAENIIQAAGFAGTLGFPLEYHLIIHWPDENQEHHNELIKRISGWQKYNIGSQVFVWARETKNGPHTHILLHIPRHLATRFRKKARQWLKKAFGVRRLAIGTLRVRRIWSLGSPFDNIRNLVRYILKGADADTRLFIGCNKWEPGIVKGKRAGFSQGLGEDARRKAGGVLPSGNRKPTQEMLRAAMVRDKRRAERKEQFKEFSSNEQGIDKVRIRLGAARLRQGRDKERTKHLPPVPRRAKKYSEI